MENKQRYWGRATIVLGFGALPVLPLTVLAALGIYFGFEVWGEDPEAIGLVCWGLAGIYGSVSLWLAAFRRLSWPVVAGLLTGLAALLPLTYGVLSSRYAPIHPLLTLILVGPLVTATAILVENFVRRESQALGQSAG